MIEVDLKRLGSNKPKPLSLLSLHGGPGLDPSYLVSSLEPVTEYADLYFYTQGSSGSLTIDGLLEELDQVVKALKGPPLVILAHSFGSALFLEHLHRKGADGGEGIIFISWMYDAGWAPCYLDRFPLSGHSNEDQDFFPSDEDFKNSMLKIAGRYFSPSFLTEGCQLLRGIRYNAKLSNSLWQSYLPTFDGKATLKKISKPIISIAGTADQVIDIAYIRKGACLSRKIRSYELDGLGHFPFLEDSTTVNRLIVNFLQTVGERRVS